MGAVMIGEASASRPFEMFHEYPDLLAVEHLCKITGESPQTIRREINNGNLPGCRIGRRLYVPKHKLVEYIESGLNG